MCSTPLPKAVHGVGRDPPTHLLRRENPGGDQLGLPRDETLCAPCWVGGWVEFVNKYDAHPPSSRSLAGIVVGVPPVARAVALPHNVARSAAAAGHPHPRSDVPLQVCESEVK